MKKFISLILLALMLASTLTVHAQSATKDWNRVLDVAQQMSVIRTAPRTPATDARDAELVIEFKTLTGRQVPLYPFTTDGCTASTNAFGRDCCVLHDVKYWIGGTRADRRLADKELMQCTGKRSKIYSFFQFIAVRIFGIPLLPFSKARFGYGWTWPQTGEQGIKY